MASSKTVPKCHSCRRSRLRCDGTQPICEKCTSRGVECLGYGAHALLWVQQTKNTSTSTPIKKGRPKLVLLPSRTQQANRNEHGKSHAQLILNVSADLQQDETQIQVSPMPVGYSDAYRIFDVLKYFNSNIIFDMTAIASIPNPYHINLEIWHYLPSILIDYLSAVVATHRIIRSQTCAILSTQASVDRKSRGLDLFAHPLKKTVYKNHRQVIQGLRAAIDDGALESSVDDIFALVAGLMTLEIQQSAYGPWNVHLEAMRTIISKRGGFRVVAKEPNYALHMFMLIEIMSHVTIPSSALRSYRVAFQMDFLEHIPSIHRDGLDVGFTCPNTLLEAIIKINHLRFLIVNTVDDDYSATDSQIVDLFEQINFFSPADWLDKKKDMASPATNYNEPATEPPQIQKDWLSLVSTFKMAVLLYFIRTLILDHKRPPSSFPVDITSLRSTASDSLLINLRHLLRPDLPRLGKFVFWPLFIAGMECHYSSSMTMVVARRFIADSLCWLAYYQGDLSMLDAASFLQHMWRIQPGMVSWDERVARLGPHSIFML